MDAWLPRQVVDMAKEAFKFLGSTSGMIWLLAVIAAGAAWGWLDLGMSVLMEAHTLEEVKRLIQAGGSVIGINNRNLNTFEVDLDTFGRLRSAIPTHCLAVAESGIGSEADVRRLRDAGCDAILVGETLMRAGQPAATLSAFRKAGAIPDMVK